MFSIESTAHWLRPIHLLAKRAGERSAGNLHAPFEVAGDGNQLTVRFVRHSQRKRGATDRSNLRSQAPFLDPTRSRLFSCRVVDSFGAGRLDSKCEDASVRAGELRPIAMVCTPVGAISSLQKLMDRVNRLASCRSWAARFCPGCTIPFL